MTVPLVPRADPLAWLRDWLDEAVEAGVPLPDAVCLATATSDGRPSARMVLLKGVENGRLCFFTDYRSRKARELERNPHAALVFYWHALHRQVRVEGRVERLPAESSDAYFATRPRGSRISAWASDQSEPVASREALLERFREAERRFTGGDVPRPPFWGGYALEPDEIEFWAGFADRRHDRVRYRREGDGWGWTRVQP